MPNNMNEGGKLGLLIAGVIILVIALFWWRAYYDETCVKDGHSAEWCDTQFWQTL